MKAAINRISIAPQKDFLERLSSNSSISALAEVIWNGLDSGTSEVGVELTENDIGGLEEIRVRDQGTGISHENVQSLFGNLGESWKKKAARFQGRGLHGKNGQGRFKAFALGKNVIWSTTAKSNNETYSYQISANYAALDSFAVTDPKPTKSAQTGTEVIISEIEKSHGSLLKDTATQDLAKLFAAYLSQYPDVRITFNGNIIDPTILQIQKSEIQLDPITLADGTTTDASVSIIEWKVPTKRAIHLCDTNGVSLREMDATLQAPGFQFTAYLKSDHIRELDKNNYLIMDDLHADVHALLTKGKEAIRTHFRRRAAERQREIVEKWKRENIYPFEEKADLTPVEVAERQVFDILAVNIESYLPKFPEASASSRKFTFRLLAQALKENPESVQKIITEVLNLKKEDQDDLAALMENTSLSNIISSATTITNRLDFLIGLENLLLDKETKNKLLERDQLHKILENEAWIFDENFALSGSEQKLEEVLHLHLGKLGNRKDEDAPVLREDQRQGRVDLMFSRVIQPYHDQRDHLVVELKRPSQKINSEVLSQVESYAIAVANDARFLTEKTRWRFIAVSNEFDDHAKRKANQRQRAKGLVFDDGDLNIEVWAFEWTEIIAAARARLHFIKSKLSYEANRETARNYLEKTHAKFIPPSDTESKSD